MRKLGLTAGSGILLMLAVGCVLAGCGSGAGAKEPSEVTIAVNSLGFPEDELLREIYSQALEAAGFRVKLRETPGLQLREALERGRISGYPTHLDMAFGEATSTERWWAPASTAVAYRVTRRRSAPNGLIPFPPTSYRRASAIAIPRSTAEQLDIKGLADLKDPSGKMYVLQREVYCYGRTRCLRRFEIGYGVVFKAFVGIPDAEPISVPYKALRSRKADAIVVTDTEGELDRKKGWLVLLEDDRRRQAATNALWMTSQRVVEEAGPAYERTILAAQRGLTVKVMRALNAEIELEGKSPAKVAAEYLKSIHFKA